MSDDKVMEDVNLRIVQVLTWPQDRASIATLSLEEKICWYSGQEPRFMVLLGQDKAFCRFWYWSYMVPLRLKRKGYQLKDFLRCLIGWK